MSDKSRNLAAIQKNHFDGCRKEMNSAIEQMCEFTGKPF